MEPSAFGLNTVLVYSEIKHFGCMLSDGPFETLAFIQRILDIICHFVIKIFTVCHEGVKSFDNFLRLHHFAIGIFWIYMRSNPL